MMQRISSIFNSKKGIILKRVLSVLLLVVLTLGMLSVLTGVLELKTSREKYKPFFDEKQDFDVLFLGTSHVINGIFPMELWKDYGITSYNFGGHGNQIATSYWVMKNALNFTNPKLVVIDCLSLDSDTKTSDNFSYVHYSLDAFPLTKTKLLGVLDLLDDENMNSRVLGGITEDSEKRSRLGLLWDFAVYHSRWNELTERDLKVEPNCELGAEMRIGVATPDIISKIPKEKRVKRNTVAMDYLRKIVNECREQGVDVLFVNLPYPANEDQQRAANSIAYIADECEVNFIDLDELGIVDYDIDCYDSNSHLNPSGARKVSEYLGRYIVENYDIKDHRDDEIYGTWNSLYEKYAEYKFDSLKNEENEYNYLMLLNDRDLRAEIRVKNKAVYEDGIFDKLINNIRDNLVLDDEEEDDGDYSVKVKVYKKDSDELFDEKTF